MQSIGRFEIIRRLGQGGMGVVYLARDPKIAREVAIKILAQPLAQNSDVRARLRREAQVIASLASAPSVPLYDYAEEGDMSYIVMAYMPGGTLAQKIAGRPLPLGAIVPILQRVSQALDAAHDRGIIHRDLKPANVLFDSSDQAFLSDFGIAKVLQDSNIVNLTGTGWIGTPAYMSPEQAVPGSPVDGRSDVYSLGIMLYEMLTGGVPFVADTPLQVMLLHADGPIPRIANGQGLALKALPKWNAILARALAKSPGDRYPTAGALVADVNRLVQATSPADLNAHGQSETRLADASLTQTLQSRHSGPFLGLTRAETSQNNRRTRPRSQMILLGLPMVLILLLVLLVFRYMLPRNNDPPSPFTAPLAQATEIGTTTPSTPTSSETPGQFTAGQYGVLLLTHSESEAGRDVMRYLQHDVNAVLVETGVQAAIEVVSVEINSGSSLQSVVSHWEPRVVMSVLVTKEDSGLSVALKADFVDEQTASKSLLATADAMSKPRQVASATEASSELADRIVLLVNAAAGYTALRDGDHTECARRFTAVLLITNRLAITFNRAEASYATRAICLDALGRSEEARADYQQAIDLNPDYALAHYGLGNYWYSHNDFAQATSYYDQTLQKVAVDPLSTNDIVGRALAGLGNIALAEGRYSDAVAFFEEALTEQPDFPAYHLAIALARRGLGHEAEARAALTTCMALARDVEPVQSDYFRQLEESCSRLLDNPSERQAIVVAQHVHLRAGPAMSHPSLGVLNAGDTVLPLGRTSESTWLNVETTSGQRGWIHAGLLTLGFDVISLSVPAAIPTAPPTTAFLTPITPTSSATPVAGPTTIGSEATSPSEPPTIPPPATQPPTIPPPPPTIPPPSPSPPPDTATPMP